MQQQQESFVHYGQFGRLVAPSVEKDYFIDFSDDDSEGEEDIFGKLDANGDLDMDAFDDALGGDDLLLPPPMALGRPGLARNNATVMMPMATPCLYC